MVYELTDGGPGQGSHQHRLTLRIALRLLADRVRELQFDDGRYLSNVGDFADALRLMAEKVKIPCSAPVNFAAHPLRSTNRVVESDWCPVCGHIHADPSECGFPMGGAGKCLCDRRVPA